MKAAIAESGGGRDTELNATVQQQGLRFAKELSCRSNDVRAPLYAFLASIAIGQRVPFRCSPTTRCIG